MFCGAVASTDHVREQVRACVTSPSARLNRRAFMQRQEQLEAAAASLPEREHGEEMAAQ